MYVIERCIRDKIEEFYRHFLANMRKTMRHVSQDNRCAGRDPTRSRQHQPPTSAATMLLRHHIKRGLTVALPIGKPSLFLANCHTVYQSNTQRRMTLSKTTNTLHVHRISRSSGHSHRSATASMP
jgi:hypothetical protein